MTIDPLLHLYRYVSLLLMYATEEDRNYRFKIFKDSLSEIDGLNAAANGTEVYGITKFSDLLPLEIKEGTVQREKLEVEFSAATVVLALPTYLLLLFSDGLHVDT